MIESEAGQRVVGLVLLLVGLGLNGWSWYAALTQRFYYPKLTMIFPFLAALGLALLLFPINMRRFRKRFRVQWPSKLGHYPLAWKLLFVLGLLAGLLNLVAISQMVRPR